MTQGRCMGASAPGSPEGVLQRGYYSAMAFNLMKFLTGLFAAGTAHGATELDTAGFDAALVSPASAVIDGNRRIGARFAERVGRAPRRGAVAAQSRRRETVAGRKPDHRDFPRGGGVGAAPPRHAYTARGRLASPRSAR